MPRDAELEKKVKSLHFATVMLLFVDKEASDSMAMEWGLDLCGGLQLMGRIFYRTLSVHSLSMCCVGCLQIL